MFSRISASLLKRRAVDIAGKRFFTSPSTDTIAFLGLGNMGFPMAINLTKKSEKIVIAFDLDDQAMKKAAEVDGMRTATSIESMLEPSENSHAPSTIVTMLPGDAAVDSVMTSIAKYGHTKTTIIDCSTVSPNTSRKWHDIFSEKGFLFVDAPVSGGVKGAQDATLTFMVGCDAQTLDNTIVPSTLSYMGSRIIPCGSPGSGAAVKLCNNLALAAQMVGICEAMNLGEALGVDPQVLADVMNTSTAKSWSCQVNNPHPVVAANAGSPASKDYEGGFGTKLMLKDLGLAVNAGKEVHVALPLGSVVKELYQLADLRGLGNKDFGIILQFLRGR
jgi:3-hydroxyisobutyrate dehydrogenase